MTVEKVVMYETVSLEDDPKVETKSTARKGFHVSTSQLIIIVVAVVVLIVAMGLIVGLTAPECEFRYAPVIGFRLPDTVKPMHYDTELMPLLPPYGNFECPGWTRIRIRCEKSTNQIVLHSDEITVTRVAIETASSEASSITEVRGFYYDVENTFLIIQLSEMLEAGVEYSVLIEFQALVNNKMLGLYRSSYEDENGNKTWFAVTQFAATYARRAFPCFDEPHFKATFNVTLVRRSDMSSITNTPIYEEVDRGNGWIADKTETTVVMSTYLLAFVVSNFEYVEDKTDGGTKIRAWGVPHKIAAGQADFALQLTKTFLTTFEQLFDFNYEMKKADLIAIPSLSYGAMENWGLVVYRESRMLYDPERSTARDKRRIEYIVAHELAHMWFGNLVTCDWWTDIWLNEGFATYYEYHPPDLIEPEYNMWDDFLILDLHPILDTDSYSTSRALVFESLTGRKEIERIYDTFSYSKGGSLNRMMSYFLTNHTWNEAMKHYLKKQKYSTATTDDLLAAISETADVTIDMKSVMHTWTMQPGFPLLDVSRNYDDGTVTITQQRFLFDKSKREAHDVFVYNIPVMYVTEDQPTDQQFYLEWMPEKEYSLKRVVNGSRWLLVNPDGAGYYRAAYDEINYNMTVDALKQDHTVFSAASRAHLINDAFTIARSGYRSDLYTQVNAMRMTEYLNNEQDYAPWKTALDAFSYPDKMLSETSAYGLWQKHMRKQVSLMYDTYGWDFHPDEEISITYKRQEATAAACKYGVPDCLFRAVELFSAWMNNASVPIPIDPNHRETAYCYAVQEGGVEEWNFAREEAEKVKDDWAAEYYRLLRALSCTTEPWLLNRHLSWSLNTTYIGQADAVNVIRYVANNNNGGRHVTWNFVRANWKQLNSVFTAQAEIKAIIDAVVNGFNIELRKEEFTTFVGSITYPEDYQVIWDEAYETINTNIDYKNTNYEDLRKWLLTVDDVTE